MINLQFNHSNALSLGIELELQLLNKENFDLVAVSDLILSDLKKNQNSSAFAWKPELIQSMLEWNSSVHSQADTLYSELKNANLQLHTICKKHGITVCGGGAHPFHAWQDNLIYPNARYEKLYQTYGYLTKLYSVFSEHIHIGCSNADDALYLTHALSRYTPHFIALSGSSPFYQGTETPFCSTRINIINEFPLSGVMPVHLKTWSDFCAYMQQMQKMGIIESMKDFYWDIRPKPEFGTVEIRVCDMPLSIHHAAVLAAYAQALASYLLNERPFVVSEKLYSPYAYNRFQATRFGVEGISIDPITHEKMSISQDILATLLKIKPYALMLKSSQYMQVLEQLCRNKMLDANQLRSFYQKTHSLPDLVKFMTECWNTEVSGKV